MPTKDHYKNLLKRLCQAENLSFKRIKFETIENFVVLTIKNQLKENAVDLECLKILSLIYDITKPFSIKYTQQLTLYPGGNRLDKVSIIFEKENYTQLNDKLQSGSFE